MAQVRFSRHARRRMKLYDINEEAVTKLLPLADEPGRQSVTRHLPGRRLPIKVVYEVKTEETVVITAYPVKKATR